jgi:acyl-CoA thioesterase-1
MIISRLFSTLIILLLITACGRESVPDAAPSGGPSGAPEPVRPGPPLDTAPWIPNTSPLTPAETGPDSLPVILVLGNSLAAGYGLTAEEAFPALIQLRIDSAGYRYPVVKAGISGETSAVGVRRIDWLLRNPVAILILELGANDALRGQDLSATRQNLQTIIDRTRAHDPATKIVIAGMQAPPNLGQLYTEEFRRIFVDLAHENDAALIPFLLEGVAADPELNQADGIHPTAAGQRILADNVWRVLEPLLRRAPS